MGLPWLSLRAGGPMSRDVASFTRSRAHGVFLNAHGAQGTVPGAENTARAKQTPGPSAGAYLTRHRAPPGARTRRCPVDAWRICNPAEAPGAPRAARPAARRGDKRSTNPPPRCKHLGSQQPSKGQVGGQARRCSERTTRSASAKVRRNMAGGSRFVFTANGIVPSWSLQLQTRGHEDRASWNGA